MMSSWWLLWLVFIVIFLVPPIGYGWGYRRWGPPYPRYIQRRRRLQAGATGASSRHESWGWGGDFVWMVLFIGVLWVLAAFWWH